MDLVSILHFLSLALNFVYLSEQHQQQQQHLRLCSDLYNNCWSVTFAESSATVLISLVYISHRLMYSRKCEVNDTRVKSCHSRYPNIYNPGDHIWRLLQPSVTMFSSTIPKTETIRVMRYVSSSAGTYVSQKRLYVLKFAVFVDTIYLWSYVFQGHFTCELPTLQLFRFHFDISKTSSLISL